MKLDCDCCFFFPHYCLKCWSLTCTLVLVIFRATKVVRRYYKGPDELDVLACLIDRSIVVWYVSRLLHLTPRALGG